MVGVSEISAAFASLQAAKDLIAGIVTLRDANALMEVKITLRGIIIDAQSALLEAQQAQAAQSQRVTELESEVGRLKDWAGEQERYELHSADWGTTVHALKETMSNGEPAHWLCSNCFADGKKSYLQPGYSTTDGAELWLCHRCGQRHTLMSPMFPNLI